MIPLINASPDALPSASVELKFVPLTSLEFCNRLAAWHSSLHRGTRLKRGHFCASDRKASKEDSPSDCRLLTQVPASSSGWGGAESAELHASSNRKQLTKMPRWHHLQQTWAIVPNGSRTVVAILSFGRGSEKSRLRPKTSQAKLFVSK